MCIRDRDVRDNRLTTLDRPLIDDITHLERLWLDGNPLHCDCELAWLRQLAVRVTVDGAACRSPADVAGQLAICYNISSCANVTDELLRIVDVRCSEDYRPPAGATTTADTETATSSSVAEVSTTADGSSFSHIGLVVGLVVAAVLVLVVVVVVWWVCRRLRRGGESQTGAVNSMNDYSTPYSTINTMTTLDDDNEHCSKT